VRALGDVLLARSRAQELCIQFGMGTRRATEIAIAVSELATNIVKYGIHGEVELVLDPDGGTRGSVRVTARDVGPPIRNLEVALQDGCDDTGPIDPALVLRRGGLGTGLGAVLRFADLFEYQQAETGKAITVTFFR
jgi:anti-sigma regulatory factor (Ser/Thr protein kinase)